MARVIQGIEEALGSTGEPGLAGLRRALDAVLRDAGGPLCFAGERRLKARVFRLRFAAGRRTRSVVAKRLDPIEARRNELAAQRWLPAVGLASAGPGLLGATPADGASIWHVYEDLGDHALEGREDDAARVGAAVGLIARIHSRFACHPLLAECRPYGSFDISYYAANVRDAIRALEALRPPSLTRSRSHAALRDRLRARLARLLAEEPRRARALAESGGPETLLHGDLWTSNTFVLPSHGALTPRLIDWDRAGVGPMSYDLSTFLLRFPLAERPWIVDLYARSLENQAWRVPPARRLEVLFETAELARYANRVIWPALAIARERAAWGFEALAEVERWFESLEPVLAREPAPRPRGARRAAGIRS